MTKTEAWLNGFNFARVHQNELWKTEIELRGQKAAAVEPDDETHEYSKNWVEGYKAWVERLPTRTRKEMRG